RQICALRASGGPHIRQRLYWVAHSDQQRRSGERVLLCEREPRQEGVEATRSGQIGRVADANINPEHWDSRTICCSETENTSDCGNDNGIVGCGETNGLGGFWRNAEWISCSDGKYRAVEPGIFPLA